MCERINDENEVGPLAMIACDAVDVDDVAVILCYEHFIPVGAVMVWCRVIRYGKYQPGRWKATYHRTVVFDVLH